MNFARLERESEKFAQYIREGIFLYVAITSDDE